MTCKIHLATDSKGRPLGLLLTGGNAADTTYFTTVLETISVRDGRPGRPRSRPDRVLADKAYTSAANRRFLTDRGIKVTIPEREDQKAGRSDAAQQAAGHEPSMPRPTRAATSSSAASTGSSSGVESPPDSTRQPGPTSPDSHSPRR